MPSSDNKVDFEKLLERLHDPLQLRVLITGLLLLVGYGGIYMPLSSRIEETTRKLSSEHKRRHLANDVDCLRAQVEKFQARLPEKADTNQWVNYVLDGIRGFPLKLINLDSAGPCRVGPYKAVVLHVQLEGEFHDLDSFLHWLEANQRLLRVDSAKIAPARNANERLVMQLTLLGIMGQDV